MYFLKQLLGIVLVAALAFACSSSNSNRGTYRSSPGNGMQFMKGKQRGGTKRIIGHAQKKKHRKMKRSRRR
ncbi:hypothetical protein ACXYMU_03380 [Pontibacter sp. CAU 1760]